MFEDATFESNGRIRTRSRGWMIATFLFNGGVLLGLILIPLIYPEALPRQALAFLLTAPPPPPAPQSPPKQLVHPSKGKSEVPNGMILEPPIIPTTIGRVGAPEQPVDWTSVAMNEGNELSDAETGVFAGRRAAVVAHPDAKGPVRVSSRVVAGLLINKNLPVYPPIAKAAGVEGTVVLQATISKMGTIENLRVVSGPAMLQQAALDAVQSWKYRPYLLNDAPVEVETTVNVVFRTDR
jgi:protein TonB